MVSQSNWQPDSSSKSGNDRFEGQLNVRIPRDVIQELARIDTVRALGAIAVEWIAIFVAMYLCDEWR